MDTVGSIGGTEDALWSCLRFGLRGMGCFSAHCLPPGLRGAGAAHCSRLPLAGPPGSDSITGWVIQSLTIFAVVSRKRSRCQEEMLLHEEGDLLGREC